MHRKEKRETRNQRRSSIGIIEKHKRAIPVFWDLRTTPAPSSTTNNNVPSNLAKCRLGGSHTEAGIGTWGWPMDKEKGRRVKPHRLD